MITLGWKYRFSFDTPLESLNGIYEVSAIYSYEELRREEIEVYEATFKDTSLTEDEYEATVLPFVRTEPIYKLTPIKGGDAVLVPFKFIKEEPDPNLEEYYLSIVTWNIGPFKSKEELTYVIDTISEYLKEMIGTENPPKLFDIGTTWLSKAEYAAIEAEREAIKGEGFTWYGKSVELEKINLALRDKCTVLEAALTQQANP